MIRELRDSLAWPFEPPSKKATHAEPTCLLKRFRWPISYPSVAFWISSRRDGIEDGDDGVGAGAGGKVARGDEPDAVRDAGNAGP